MADLFERIFVGDASYEKIGVHTFHAVLVDLIEGGSTRAQVISGLNLDAEAEAQFDVLIAKIQSVGSLAEKHRFANEFHAVGMIAEVGLKYTTKIAFKTRLGF